MLEITIIHITGNLLCINRRASFSRSRIKLTMRILFQTCSSRSFRRRVLCSRENFRKDWQWRRRIYLRILLMTSILIIVTWIISLAWDSWSTNNSRIITILSTWQILRIIWSSVIITLARLICFLRLEGIIIVVFRRFQGIIRQVCSAWCEKDFASEKI